MGIWQYRGKLKKEFHGKIFFIPHKYKASFDWLLNWAMFLNYINVRGAVVSN